MAKTRTEQIAEIDKKIETLTLRKTALQAQQDSLVNFADVQTGRVVDFPQGKGDNVRTYTGAVIGRKNAEKEGEKDLIRVAVGDGFEAQIITLAVAKVTKLHPVEVAEEVQAA